MAGSDARGTARGCGKGVRGGEQGAGGRGDLATLPAISDEPPHVRLAADRVHTRIGGAVAVAVGGGGGEQVRDVACAVGPKGSAEAQGQRHSDDAGER